MDVLCKKETTVYLILRWGLPLSFFSLVPLSSIHSSSPRSRTLTTVSRVTVYRRVKHGSTGGVPVDDPVWVPVQRSVSLSSWLREDVGLLNEIGDRLVRLGTPGVVGALSHTPGSMEVSITLVLLFEAILVLEWYSFCRSLRKMWKLNQRGNVQGNTLLFRDLEGWSRKYPFLPLLLPLNYRITEQCRPLLESQ